MTIWQAIILGLVQGLTEFLPISSSAHLVLVPFFLKWTYPSLLFDVSLHFGTLVAIIVVFWKELIQILKNTRWIVLLTIGTLPAAIGGILWYDTIENIFKKPEAVAGFLIITGILLVWGQRAKTKDKNLEDLTGAKVLIVGLAQACALVPGLSRSGLTIVAGLRQGLKPVEAVKFSFLLATPIILGAVIKELPQLISVSTKNDYLAVITGTLVAGISGYLTIKFFLQFVKNKKLNFFAYYCWLLAIFTLLIYRLR